MATQPSTTQSSLSNPQNMDDTVLANEIAMSNNATTTSADSTDDLYNSPWPAQTPVNDEKSDNVTIGDGEGSPGSPKPAALIPGLSLINDKLAGQEPSNEQITSSLELDAESHTVDRATVIGENEAHRVQTATGKDKMDLESTTNRHVHEKPSEIKADENAEGTLEVGASINAGGAKNEQESREATSATGDAMETELTTVQHAHGDDTNEQVVNGSTNITDTAEDMDNDDESEHPEWETDSSPLESSSNDSSTDSSDDSDDDDDDDDIDYPILSPEEQARILMQAEGGSDDEGEGKGKAGGNSKTTNELPEEVLPIPDITVTPDMKITFLGNITSIVDNAVLIEAHTSGEYQVLEYGSLLCLEDRSVAGVVSETLGRVEQPLYAALYPTASEVEKRGLTKGKPVYYVDSRSTFVFTQPLKGLKGSDASNFHDEEIGEDEVEFSDDEAEAEYKRKLKQKQQEKREAKHGPAKSKRPLPGPSKLSQTELNYDDDAGPEDGYTPLARPQNLHDMMGQQETLIEEPVYSGRGSFRGGRGRGRGYDRGRGGRGRGGGRGGSQQPRENHRPRQQCQQPSSPDNATPTQSPNFSQGFQSPSGQPATTAYGVSPQFAPYMPFFTQPQVQGSLPTQFPFQLPYQQTYQQAYQQPSAYQQYPQFPPAAHVNPAFLAALQQQQQQQQQQQYQSAQQTQVQDPTSNFEQVRAQLNILQQLSGMSQGSRPS